MTLRPGWWEPIARAEAAADRGERDVDGKPTPRRGGFTNTMAAASKLRGSKNAGKGKKQDTRLDAALGPMGTEDFDDE